MTRKQNYSLLIKILDADEYWQGVNHQAGDEGPWPGTVVIVELDGKDIFNIIGRAELMFWERECAEVFVEQIKNLWNERFGGLTRIKKRDVDQFMNDCDLIVKDKIY